MPSFTRLTAALALTGAAIATPVQKRDAFSVEQVARSEYLKIGPEQLIRTLQKYGKPVPQNLYDAVDQFHSDNVQAASDGGDSGSVSAAPEQYDQSYLSPVTLGKDTVHLDFDTGSADLWTFSSLQASSSLAGHDYYHVDSSKKLSGYSWKIGYGDGSGASGTVYADKVVVGGVTATRQAVEAATSVSAQFAQDSDNDGLLGLAFSAINTVKPQKQTTFFDTVRDQLAAPLFAATLKYRAAGTYDFGYIDSSKYTGSITYVDVDSSQGFWGISGTGYSIGKTTTRKNFDTILDTGTSLIYADDDIVDAYYAKVSGAQFDNSQGGYTFPCSSSTPDLSFTIGGVKQVVPGKYLNYAPVSRGSSTCFGGVQSSADVGTNILGDVFLKSKYVVFENDGDAPRAGLAQQAGV